MLGSVFEMPKQLSEIISRIQGAFIMSDVLISKGK